MALFRSKSIRARLLKILILAIGGVVAVTVVVWRVSIEPSLRMGVAREQEQLARRVADQIDEFLDKRIGGLLLAVEVGRFWENGRDGQKEALYRLLKLDPQVHEVSVADRDGQQVLRLSRTQVYSDADLISLKQEEKFQQAIQGRIYVGNVYHARTAEPFITLTVPIKFTATDIRGVVAAEVSLKTLWDSISHIKIGQSGHAFVVDREGRLIAHPDYSKVLLGTNLAHLDEVREFLTYPDQDPEPGKLRRGESGVNAISTFAAAKRRPWGVFVEEPAVTALAEVKRVERFASLIVLLLLAGAFGLSYLFSERIAQPVRKLEEGTKLIAQGNLEHKLEIHTGDEIETLAHHFDQMAQALKASYEGLEAKIAERTKEISALYSTLTPLTPADSVDQMLERVIERVMEATGADAGLVRIMDKTTGAFVYPAQIGFPSSYLEATQRLQEASAIALAFRTGEPVIAANIAEDPRLKGKRQLEGGFKSCAFLPLKVAGQIRGVIHLASRKLGHFSEEKRDHLMAIARQMGIAMENRELFEESQRRSQEQAALSTIATAISQSLQIDHVLQVALDKTLDVTGRAVGFVRLKDEVTGGLRVVAHRGISEAYVQALEKAERIGWIAAKVLATGETVTVNDPSPGDFLEDTWEEGIRATAWVPVSAHGQVLGVLTIASKTARPFDAREAELLKAIGNIVGTAVANARLYEETSHRAEMTESLNTLSRLITSSLSVQEVFSFIAQSLVTLLNAQVVRLWVYDSSQDVLLLKGAAGEPELIPYPQDVFRPGEGLVGSAFQSKEVVLITDPATDPRYGRRDWAQKMGITQFIGMPILLGNRALGAISAAFRSSRPFREEDISLVRAFADQAAIAVQNAQLFEETQSNLDRIRLLREIEQTITSTLDLRTLLDVLLEKIALVLPYSATTVRLFNKESGLLEPVACRNIDEKEWKAEQWRGGRGIAGMAFGRKSAWTVRNVQTDPSVRDPEFFRRHGLVSYLGVPLIGKEKILGVLGFYTKEEHEFGDGEVEFLCTLAGQAAIAIHNSQLYEEAQFNLERIQALREIDRAMTSSLDLPKVLDVLLEKIDLVLPYAAATVRLFNKQSGLLEPVACRNLDEKEWKVEQWRGGRGIPNAVFETKAPVMISNVQTDPAVKDVEFFRRHGLVSYLGVPLIVKEEILGVISFYTKEEHHFSDGEVEFLTTLAGQAAIAIHNSQLYEEMKNQAVELEKSNQVKDEFLSVMSHELRTPLNVIMGYTGMIKDRMVGEISPEQERILAKVVSHSKELLTMISGILAVTNIETEAVKVQRDEVHLARFLDGLKTAYPIPSGKKLTLNWDYPADLPVVNTDSEKLKLILQNLISNAMKFTPEGSVTISGRVREDGRTSASSVEPQQAAASGEAAEASIPGSRLLPRPLSSFVEFKVADTGIGIAKEFFPVIFEKFRQVDSSETRPYGGVGMGLYIVKKFAELLGGKVEVESEPGKGSTFTVTIPKENHG